MLYCSGNSLVVKTYLLIYSIFGKFKVHGFREAEVVC